VRGIGGWRREEGGREGEGDEGSVKGNGWLGPVE